MITMLTAYTTEIDEIDDAMDEIFAQIDLGSLKKNSVGLISTYYDFVESGVVEELCDRLPFDVIGMTTMAGLSKGDYGMYRLNLTVLTSDDLIFETASTDLLNAENYEKEIEKTYKETRAKLPGDPSFIISYCPIPSDLSGFDMISSFDRIVGGLPIWGGMASDMDMSYVHCRTIRNGEIERLSLSMLLIYGDIEPEFIVTSIPENNIHENRGIITESEGCTIKTVNGMLLSDYMMSIGIPMRAGKDLTTLPLLVDYGDGTKPVALGIFSISDNGDAICGGEMPQDKSFSVGEINAEGILETAQLSMNELLATEKKSGVLMMPCVTRYIMLAPEQNAESVLVKDALGDKIPYALSYAGGEVCPVLADDGKYHNRFHNYTFSAVIF